MVTRYFVRVDNTEQPVALFRLVADPLAESLEETQWETNVGWVGTDRLVAYLIDGSPIVDEVNERTAMRAFPDAFVSRVAKVTIAKHLAGKHDQSSHGRGGGMGAPREESRAKQKLAWELHEQGLTWEQVAQKAGYANSGAARLAGKAHEKRLKSKGDKAEDEALVTKPKPDPDKDGAQEIARAQAIIDKATGGRPVADVLAEERAKAKSSVAEPTAKELEVTEAVIEAGSVLRGEVERRRVVAGKDAVAKAESELQTMRKDLEPFDKQRAEIISERANVKAEMQKRVRESKEYDNAVNALADEASANTTSEAVRDAITRDRQTVMADMREYSRLYDTTASFNERDAFLEKRAKEMFPDNKKAQTEYKRRLGDAVFLRLRAERNLTTRDEKYAELSRRDKRLLDDLSESSGKSESLRIQIKERETLIRLGGVTPEQNAEIIRSVLMESGRTMTDKPNQRIAGTKPAVAELRTELTKIPDELWKDNSYPYMRVTAVKSGRGHWSESKQEIKTDGEKGSGRRASTLLHEATHAVENMNTSVTQLQHVMFERRAKGEKPRKLKDIRPGSGYRGDEVAVEDKWTNPYSGKKYRGGGRLQNHEIMTMGIESLYKRDRYPQEIADEDHLNFVMGVLAYA